MPDSINDIISSLSGIEESACKVLDATEEEKRSIDKSYSKKKSDFAAMMNDKYSSKLAAQEKKILDEKQKEVDTFQHENDALISELEKRYNTHKDEWVDEIFAKVIGV